MNPRACREERVKRKCTCTHTMVMMWYVVYGTSMAWCGSVWYGMVLPVWPWCGSVWYGMVLPVWHGVVVCGTVWYYLYGMVW